MRDYEKIGEAVAKMPRAHFDVGDVPKIEAPREGWEWSPVNGERPVEVRKAANGVIIFRRFENLPQRMSLAERMGARR